MSLYAPDRYFDRITAVDVRRDLLDVGLTHALVDMDNTLVSRQSHDVPLDVRAWLGRAREAGIKLCIVSNNWHRTPFEWAEKLGLPVVAKACKPLPYGLAKARSYLGGTPENTVVIGDQIATDIIGAHLLHMKGYLVCPLVKTDLPHTRVLRMLENALIGEQQPETAMVESIRTMREED